MVAERALSLKPFLHCGKKCLLKINRNILRIKELCTLQNRLKALPRLWINSFILAPSRPYQPQFINDIGSTFEKRQAMCLLSKLSIVFHFRTSVLDLTE